MGHGGMSHPLKFARLLMILFNIILFLIGATLLGEGIDLLLVRRFYNFTELISTIQSSNYTQQNKSLSDGILYIVMIVPGITILLIGFFGCSGAITQIQCLLFINFAGIIINLIFQMIITITLIVFPSKVKEKFIHTIRILIREKYKGPLEKSLPLSSYLWDLMMHQLQCCGVENKYDFNTAKSWNRTNPWWENTMSIENRYFKYPLTCCSMNHILNQDVQMFQKNILSCAIDGNNLNEIGCYKKIIDFIYMNQATVFTVILTVILLEMTALVFVLVIYNRNRIEQIHDILESSPPPYSTLTRRNNSHLYSRL